MRAIRHSRVLQGRLIPIIAVGFFAAAIGFFGTKAIMGGSHQYRWAKIIPSDWIWEDHWSTPRIIAMQSAETSDGRQLHFTFREGQNVPELGARICAAIPNSENGETKWVADGYCWSDKGTDG
jgi:hypothetical protein